jgi:hypothetical protein
MLVPEATVRAEDTADGGALTFVAPAEVPELRRRVRVLAQRMNAHFARNTGVGLLGGVMRAKQAQVEDIDHGATMRMTPVDPAKVSGMRDLVRMHARMLNATNDCWMLVAPGQ